MKIRLRWLLSGLVAVAVAVVVAAYAVLATMDFEDLREVIEAEGTRATGRELRVAGAIDLQVSLVPAIALEKVTLGNAEWGVWPEMLSVRRIEAEVALLPLLSGEIEVRRLVVVEPMILLETHADGRANWVMAGAAEAPRSKATDEDRGRTIPAFLRIDVRDARLLYRHGASGRVVEVNLTRLQAAADDPASPARIALNGAYEGAAFEVTGTLGSRDRFLRGDRFPLDLVVEAGGTTLELTGDVSDPAAGQGFDLGIAAQGESLAALAPFAGQELPALGPYAMAAQVHDEARDGGTALRLSGMSAKLGGSDVAGDLTVELGGARPALSGALTSETLDVADLRPPGAGADPPAESATPAEGRRFVLGEEPLPLDGLGTLDARLEFAVGRLVVDEKLELADVDATLTLENGRLRLAPLRAGLAGATLAGEFSLDAARPAPPAALTLAVRGFDYGRLLRELEVTDGVSGALDADLRLHGAGASPRALAASLGGRIDLVGGEGRVRDELLQASGAGLIDMVSAWRERGDDLRLNCVVGRLPVEGGVMTSEAILIDTAAVTVGGTGTVDLRDETLDLRVVPQAKKTSLLSLAVPFRIAGTLAEPRIGPDPVGTAVGAARIAGLFLNPLVAGAAIVLDSETSDQNPCVAAVQSADQAPGEGQAPPSSEGAVIDRAAEGVGDAVKGVGEGISRGLKSLFGQ